MTFRKEQTGSLRTNEASESIPGRDTAPVFPFRIYFYAALAVLLGLLFFHNTRPLALFDLAGLLAVQAYPTSAQDNFAIFLAVIGAPFASVLVIGMLSLTFFWRRQFKALVLFLGLFTLLTGFEVVSKIKVEHPRPMGELVRKIPAQAWYQKIPDVSVPGNNSFPSGHCFRAVFLAGILMSLFWPAHARARKALLIAAAAYVLAAGWSRVYLGAHWPSDVLGGFMLGAIGLMVFYRSTGR